MNKRYLYTVLTICLSGMLLAVLGVLLKLGISHASPLQATMDTPDLVVNAEVDDETTLADAVISYTILYTNTLAQDLSDVLIVSTLMHKQYYTPTYLSDPLIPTTSFTYSGNFDDGYALLWTLGTLPANTGGWIIFTTTVPPEAEPPWDDSKRWPLLGMSAAITTSTPGVSTGNPQGEPADSVSVMVVGPVLRISKAASPDQVRPGRLLTYTLTLQNKEREDVIAANGIVITDALPDNTTFYAASGTGAFSDGLVTWRPPDPLDPGNTLEVSFTVRITASMPKCQPDPIRNNKEDYMVSSDETIQTVKGNNDRSTTIDDVLEKTIQTPPVPSGAKAVFPGGIVTYTINVYNPYHDQALTGLRLTDTLPGVPTPFIFQNMLYGGPTPITTSPQVVWENLSVGAGGVLTVAFRAQVPYHIDIGANDTTRSYKNSVSASALGLTICDMRDQNPSEAIVTRQIWMDKTVDPTHVLSGEIVTYTITLENLGDTPISFIRLTDTLPYISGEADFYFVDMVGSGPPPEAGYQHNPVVWDNLSVPPYSTIEFSFHARAIGWPEKKYKNNLYASAPQTTIPDRTNRAEVKIDSPLRISKVVDPQETFVNTSVEYSVTICNVATGTYTLDWFRDRLPAGFFSGGSNLYEYDIDPPVDLASGECWEHAFPVDVSADVVCDQTYRNEAEQIKMGIIAPVTATFVNLTDLAPLRVNPHVTIAKVRDHAVVLLGETVVYTITLSNASSILIDDDVAVEDILPAGFEFVEMVVGPDPDSTEPTVVWENQTIPALGQLVLAFRVLVPPGVALETHPNDVHVTYADLVCIKNIDNVAGVKVVSELVEPSKVVNPSTISPFGVVRYEIRLKNLDTLPITGTVVTETLPKALLPPHFEFLGMVTGDPEPSEVNTLAGGQQQVIWRDLTVPGNQGTLRLRFDAKAAILLDTYKNEVGVQYFRGRNITVTADWDVEAPVTVQPGVVMYKTVFPTKTQNGGRVVYTITLYNQLVDLATVRITDTLPAGFSYYRSVSLPSGAALVRQSPLVWTLSQLKKGNSAAFVFEARVGADVISGTHLNTVEASSPSAQIPAAEDTAPVMVEWRELPTVYLPLVLRNNTQ